MKSKAKFSVDIFLTVGILMAIGGWWYSATRTPTPYYVYDLTHRFQDGRVYVDAFLDKRACERLPINEDGFFVVIKSGTGVERTEWRPEDGRKRNENLRSPQYQ